MGKNYLNSDPCADERSFLLRLRSIRRQVASGAIAGLLALPLGISSAPAYAESEEMIEGVVVTGVRGKPGLFESRPFLLTFFHQMYWTLWRFRT